MKQPQLAKILALKRPVSISRWENGEAPVPWFHFTGLINALQLDRKEFLDLVSKEIPDALMLYQRHAPRIEDATLRQEVCQLIETASRLDDDALATLQRCADAFQVEDPEVRQHLIGQLKLIERLMKPWPETDDRAGIKKTVRGKATG